MVELILVRHGETTGESSLRLNGATDVPLSELGSRQARRVGEALGALEIDRVLVSPLTRSQESARLAFPALRTRTAVVPDLREVDFGRWETLTWDEVRARDPEGYAAFEARGDDFAYPGGESLAGFRNRVATAARAALPAGSGRTVAVLHKGVIRVVMATLLERQVEELGGHRLELGSIHRLRRVEGRWVLHSADEVGHLGPDRTP